MKRILILAVFSAVVSCNQKELQTTNIQTTPEMSEQEMMDEATRVVDSAAAVVENKASVDVYGNNPDVKNAMELIDESTEWVKKGMRKEVTQKESNEHINTIMKEFDKINSRLSDDEKIRLENYRSKKIEEIIDLQVGSTK